MSGATVRLVAQHWIRWRELLWALPWLLFLAFPVVDLVVTPRSAVARALAAVGLLVFTGAYVGVFRRAFGACSPTPWGRLLVVAVLAVGLGAWLGPSWTGLMIYVAAAAAAALPLRWVWPAVVGAGAVCAALLAGQDMLGDLIILPVMCLLTAFALQGTRHLISVNAQLREAREELAHNAVAEERLRFARDLHDLLGHSLSMIALKSELAGRLALRDPARARAEMADVESAVRRALAEVRDAVSGYRQVSLRQSVAEARDALSAAGIALAAPASTGELPPEADAVLGWVIREATTNVLRHSGAERVTVRLERGADDVTLVVADDGRGNGGRGDGGPPGAGLSGLAERLARIGGRLETRPEAGAGFTLTAVVPLRVPVPDPVTAR